MTLYFACDSNSQKARNLRRSSKVSITINKDWAGWKKIQGLSIGARATILKRPADTDHALALLTRKFKEMKGLSEADLETTVFVRVQPKVISVRDYRRGFGWTKLVKLIAIYLGFVDIDTHPGHHTPPYIPSRASPRIKLSISTCILIHDEIPLIVRSLIWMEEKCTDDCPILIMGGEPEGEDVEAGSSLPF